MLGGRGCISTQVSFWVEGEYCQTHDSDLLLRGFWLVGLLVDGVSVEECLHDQAHRARFGSMRGSDGCDASYHGGIEFAKRSREADIVLLRSVATEVGAQLKVFFRRPQARLARQ